MIALSIIYSYSDKFRVIIHVRDFLIRQAFRMDFVRLEYLLFRMETYFDGDYVIHSSFSALKYLSFSHSYPTN
jgi:hypothetical protein